MSQFDIITNVNAKSNVSPAEKEQLYNHVIWEGTKAAAVAAGVSTVAAAAAHQTLPGFRRVSLPFKTFLVLAVTTGAFFTVTDRVSIRVSREVAARRAIDSTADVRKDISPVAKIEPITGVRQWVIKHRYPLVMSLWSGTLAGAFLYNWQRRDIPAAQKVINARLVAQTMALAGIGGLAALAATDPHERQVDRHFEKVLQEQGVAV